MNFLEALQMAWWSLTANLLRSFLTLLGIIIGVTAIISVASVINGLNLYVDEKVITLGPSSFEVSRFGMITSREQFLRAIRRNPPLRWIDLEAIRDRLGLSQLSGVKVYGNADVRWRGQLATNVNLKGITPEILLLENYEIASGRGISREDQERAAPVVFLGADIAELLFGGIEPVGKEIKVRGRRFEVVGVGMRRGSVFGQSRDSYVLIPINTFRKLYDARESLALVVRAPTPADLEPAMDEVRSILRARHHLRYDEEDDFGLMSAEAMNEFWKRLTRTIFQVALFVVGISLVVGGIVIMNIMLVSVIERTREIGVRKAVGARHRDVRLQFLVESATLAAAGGLVGVVLAWFATRAVAVFTPLPAVFPWWAPALAIGLSSTVGIAFGLYPAIKAARLDPIHALRSDG